MALPAILASTVESWAAFYDSHQLVSVTVAERAVSRGGERGWRWLGLFSGASLGLWLAILFAGIWLTVAA